jgi:hypothetical protein
VTGDLRRDIIVGAPGAGDEGAGMVVAFPSDGQPVAFASVAASPAFGRSVGTSDVDGDGIDDVIASGQGGIAWFHVADLQVLDEVSLQGINGMAIGADVNRDGFGDVLVGSDETHAMILMGPGFDVRYRLAAPSSVEPAGPGRSIAFIATPDGGGSAFVSDPSHQSTSGEARGAVFLYNILDTDRDTWFDGFDNCSVDPNPSQANVDGKALPNGPRLKGDDVTLVSSDTLGDACDGDDDNDGLSDEVEASWPMALCPSAFPTDARDMDSDGDHLADGWECETGTDPSNPWSGTAKPLLRGDADADRIQDAWEERGYNASTSSADSDGDGCADLVEIASVDGNRYITQIDYLAVTRASAPIWPFDVEQHYALDVSKNGALGDEDRLFVARALLLSDWLPKGCP